MRCVIFMLLSVALLVSALAQSPTQPQPPSDPPPGAGEEITIDDLQGVTITCVIEAMGRTRWSGDKKIGPTRHHSRMVTQIGPGGTVRWTADVSVRIDNKWDHPWHYSFSEIIGQPNTKPDARTGARSIVLTFESNTLTFLRVFIKGGHILKILFSRVPSGLGCTVTASFVNEVGAGNPTVIAPIKGGYREYIGMKQTSSTCRVSKK